MQCNNISPMVKLGKLSWFKQFIASLYNFKLLCVCVNGYVSILCNISNTASHRLSLLMIVPGERGGAKPQRINVHTVSFVWDNIDSLKSIWKQIYYATTLQKNMTRANTLFVMFNSPARNFSINLEGSDKKQDWNCYMEILQDMKIWNLKYLPKIFHADCQKNWCFISIK